MTQTQNSIPLLITARNQNVPENYVVLTKLKTGEVIAVREFIAETVSDFENVELLFTDDRAA